MYIPTIKEILSISKKKYKENGVLKTTGIMLLWLIISYAILFIPMLYLVQITKDMQQNSMDYKALAISVTLQFIASLVMSLFMVGIYNYLINIVRGLAASVKDLLFGFKRSAISNALIPLGYIFAVLPYFAIIIIPSVIMSTYEYNTKLVLPCMLLIIVGFVLYIIAILKYVFVISISADQTNHKYNLVELFRISKKMTKGYKKKILRLFAVLWLIAVCVQLVFQIFTVIVAQLVPDTTTPLTSVLGIVFTIAYLIVLMLYVTYSLICFHVLYVAINDKYFGVKPTQSNFKSAIDTEIDAILKSKEDGLLSNLNDDMN